jgi:hypothetical protein
MKKKSALKKEYNIKECSNIKRILGINIIDKKYFYLIDQTYNIKQLISKFPIGKI